MDAIVKKIRRKFTTRRGTLEDLGELQQLYVETINKVCRNDYNQDQLNAWCSGIENKERWEALLRDQFVLVALSGDEIVGFASLDKGSYIDMFYVHKDFQGQGLASLLYSLIEEEVLAQGTIKITADISETARPFFERKGFVIDAQQTFPVKGIMISNFRMSKVFQD